MSEKTITVASRIIGPVGLGIANGEQRIVTFEEKDGIGVAMVDNEEAEVLLGAIGKPDYWKPGSEDLSLEDIINADPAAKAAADAITGMTGLAIANLVKKINKAETAEDVDTLVGTETNPKVLTAASKRKDELIA
jgi:hypothetical protein